ncbi:SDR family NAD(P)-dependent oxidoreductase [Streptomyces sp. NPDC049577]|uniref:SDR family NAD(P)-dependent oxidoreductase n=1 Tax=Streptomyces sp. NPDC049577 TaxID=3155153 RepID=UPI0034420398
MPCDSSRDGAKETAEAVKAAGGDAVTHQADLTRVAEVEGLFDAAVDAFGRVDASVNTAGMVIKKPMSEATEAEYDRMFAVNSKAAYFVMREAAKRIERDGGIITIVTSLPAAYTGPYSVTPRAEPAGPAGPGRRGSRGISPCARRSACRSRRAGSPRSRRSRPPGRSR